MFNALNSGHFIQEQCSMLSIRDTLFKNNIECSQFGTDVNANLPPKYYFGK